MKVLLCFATRIEMLELESKLSENFQSDGQGAFWGKNMSIKLLVTGVGVPSTIFFLQNILSNEKFDLVINAGIAGAFHSNLDLGEVVLIEKDRFADLGVEEKDGSFTDVFEMHLAEKNEFPFQNGWIENTFEGFNFLKSVPGITVNKVHGTEASINLVKNKYPEAKVESMEGAGAAFVCALTKNSFLQIRSISNYVEPRNRDNWQIEKALSNLSQVLLELLLSLTAIPT
ncbi:MAG: futalosine hydrolase [Saprospiraceae bacterium]